MCLQQFFSQIYANSQRVQLQGAAANMSVTQMKQFVANDLRAMKTQSKAVALHISASEVRSCLQNLLFFSVHGTDFTYFDSRCMIFVKLFRQSRGKKVTALRFSFPWSIVWYKTQIIEGWSNQIVFPCICCVQMYVDVIKTNQDIKILGEWRRGPRYDLLYRRLHRATKTNQPLTQAGGLSFNEL